MSIDHHLGGFLFEFEAEQRILRVGDVEMGGRPGELPVVLIGSIFHEGHGIVEDRSIGKFNEARARKLILKQERASRKTGVPCMLDVVAETTEAMERNLSFVAGETDSPLLVNATSAEVRIHGIEHAKDIGIIDRVVYDSINYRIDDREVEMIRNTGVEAALIQAFNPRNPMPAGMVEVVSGSGGLLERSEEAGISKHLLFAPVLDLPSVGFATKGVHLLKSRTGYPTGTAPVGVVGRSNVVGSMGPLAKQTSRSAVVSLCQAGGADFVIYGSIARAGQVFPASAVVDAGISYAARASGVRPKSKSGPLHTLFQRPA
jgi:tetrahydromethanopterin S-methyltransferase subunit H